MFSWEHPNLLFHLLARLVENGYEVVGVITAPDKPAGRGYQLTPSAVKKYAVEQGLRVLQPEKLRNPAFLSELRSLQADLQVVVAFRMLPAVVFEMPKLGTFNLHASLLPQYRGAAPINWAIINGETETGATTFFIEQTIDTGKLIFQTRIPIGDTETAGELHDRLQEVGADLVLKTVQAIEQGQHPEVPQPDFDNLKPAPKIFKETCEIDWQQPARTVYNFIRGLSPYPTAYTTLNGKLLKIYRTSFTETSHNEPPGTVQTDRKTYLHFAAADGWVELLEVQLEGKKRMLVGEFLRGQREL